jgi:hypothetical protein
MIGSFVAVLPHLHAASGWLLSQDEKNAESIFDFASSMRTEM